MSALQYGNMAYLSEMLRTDGLPGESQYEWEPQRNVARKVLHHSAYMQVSGNAIVSQQIDLIFKGILEVERSRRGKSR